jgi:chorismate--pyruvate lyase
MTTPPQHLLPWLECTSYMMEQLFAKSQNTELQVLQQIWEPANSWDQQKLSLKVEQVLHRDIIVKAWGAPCWFARTILPRATFDAHFSLFDRLQQEPLGNLIFHTSEVRRLNLQYYAIAPHAVEYAWLPTDILTQQQTLWARLSTFQVANVELFYLIEILLPDLERYCS